MGGGRLRGTGRRWGIAARFLISDLVDPRDSVSQFALLYSSLDIVEWKASIGAHVIVGVSVRAEVPAGTSGRESHL